MRPVTREPRRRRRTRSAGRTRKHRNMADLVFQVGDAVVARRETRLRMTVNDVGDERSDSVGGVVPRMYLCTVDEEAPPTHRRLREASKRHTYQHRYAEMVDAHHVYDHDDGDFEERPPQSLDTRTWHAWLQNVDRPASPGM